MKQNNLSTGHMEYLKSIKKEKRIVFFSQWLLLIGFLALWEILARLNIIDVFLFSKPSDIYALFVKYLQTGELLKHVLISSYETVVGLVIGTVLGILIAIFLWWSERLSKILDPFLVVLNALHKDDTYVSLEKQYKMLHVINDLYENALKCVRMGIPQDI